MYNPLLPPQQPEQLTSYLNEEHQRIADAFNDIKEGLWEISYSLPVRYKPGLVKYFDGVNADPLGTGQEGLYRYGLDNLWHYVG